MAFLPCARAMDGSESASDAAPAVVMKRRRDAPCERSSIFMVCSSCWGASSDSGSVGFVTDETPDLLRQRLELGQGSGCVAAWTRQWNVDDGFQSSRMRGHHGDAIAEEHGFVDRVRDEHHGAALGRGPILSPDAQHL